MVVSDSVILVWAQLISLAGAGFRADKDVKFITSCQKDLRKYSILYCITGSDCCTVICILLHALF